MSAVAREVDSQPDVWRRALELLSGVSDQLPARGERVALIGCGTSYYVAQALAVARERAGHGETDAFAASEMPSGRSYDLVAAISRSGTTTEVVRALNALAPTAPTLAISAMPDSPVVHSARRAVLLPFADETSIVQTRFATTVLALLRAHIGEDLAPVISDAVDALAAELHPDLADFEQFVFLGRGWTVGLAHEAALKFREAAGAWAESYPAMEYRHGPISIAGPGTLVWLLGPAQRELVADIQATGAVVLEGRLDPLAELILIQRSAIALALARGLDPDRPSHLSRSVVL